MNKTIIAPSILSANFANLEKDIKTVENYGADWIHVDVMDGHFVPNLTIGACVVRDIRKITNLPLDVHLMIKHPIDTIGLFTENLKEGDTIYIHPESEEHPSTTLQKIIDAGMVPGIAINPGTSVESVRIMLRIVKKVLVMSVNPGNASQVFLPYVREKYDQLLFLKDDIGFEVYWDGACSADKIQEYAPLGVKGFVLGTTLLFGKQSSYSEILKEIRGMSFEI